MVGILCKVNRCKNLAMFFVNKQEISRRYLKNAKYSIKNLKKADHSGPMADKVRVGSP
jgi:CO dehydrogenase/acetyl-CoA synthase epsilon subunit